MLDYDGTKMPEDKVNKSLGKEVISVLNGYYTQYNVLPLVPNLMSFCLISIPEKISKACYVFVVLKNVKQIQLGLQYLKRNVYY